MARQQLHPKQIANIMTLDGPERVEHMIKRIADFEEVWGLYNDGWVSSALDDDTGVTMFPIWPDPEYAMACAEGEWASCHPKAIPLAHFMEAILPTLEAEGSLVSLFRLPGGTSVPVTPQTMRDMVESELANYA